MIGKQYIEVSKNLWKHGWACIIGEENWSRFYKYDSKTDYTKILEIEYNNNGIVTHIYSTSY